MDFIDESRDVFGVEPICTTLRSAGVRVAPSTYYAKRGAHAQCAGVPRRGDRPGLQQLWEDNYRVYGARKLWKAAQRAGHDVGRDQVARHMRAAGITGVRRGKRCAPPNPTPPQRGIPNWSVVTSPRPRRISCG